MRAVIVTRVTAQAFRVPVRVLPNRPLISFFEQSDIDRQRSRKRSTCSELLIILGPDEPLTGRTVMGPSIPNECLGSASFIKKQTKKWRQDVE